MNSDYTKILTRSIGEAGLAVSLRHRGGASDFFTYTAVP